jgi:DNA mismatch repair protein MutL
MPQILILPESLINKIAAGEIIERPACVVRELIDNSIDAGATQINIETLHGGKKLIKVYDNGIGMDRDDASLCFERYATSKIKSEDDLFNISTLGFRGEALPAIASISKVILTTSTKDSNVGIKVEIGVNRKKEIKDAPSLQGTTIEVRDIFYNTPARRKFLKTITTELSHIIEIVIQKAFAYPGISFSLLHNNNEILSTHATADLKERFIQLYGEELVSEFLEIKKETEGIKFYGFISKPDFTRTGRRHQLIFVNKRPVKNPTVTHAIYNAYGNFIPKDKHPAYFLFLEIDPKKIDVNVHPAKREVRFERPDEIHELIESAIHEFFHSGQSRDISRVSIQEMDSHIKPLTEYKPHEINFIQESQSDFFTSGVTSITPTFFHIGEAFIAEVKKEGLMIIDQHAAHERILYEKFLKKTSIETESLFLPLRIELPPREFNIIMEYKNQLRDFGLEIEDFGTNNVIIRALPKELQKADIKGLLMDIATGIVEEETEGIKGKPEKQKLLQKIAAQLACHRSLRSRDPLSNEEISRMINELNKTQEPDKCPHGRPTRIFFSIDDLKKMFKRK